MAFEDEVSKDELCHDGAGPVPVPKWSRADAGPQAPIYITYYTFWRVYFKVQFDC